ncbi:hemerythrin domain-containing protein [Shewanella youngdeokensis]|uniref:Hemerythrin domain-containing protein n=1 Tax=Shewanella youngdeokensis TaxID=2999068 RepID=A0ABZ0JVJ3_9GAMM|nr:hemerythrin domain-containing protein [Shewanella sp. DAU334]
MLARLMKDHAHIAILLNILKAKRSKLVSGDLVNYNLVRDIVEYMQSYAEHSHHPLEEVISEFYWHKQGKAYINETLTFEHEKLANASVSLMATLNLILSDIVVPKENLVTDLESYVELQQSHMEFEEAKVFPKWSSLFTELDWKEIREMCRARIIDDPLFSENDSVLFEELKEYIEQAKMSA